MLLAKELFIIIIPPVTLGPVAKQAEKELAGKVDPVKFIEL